MLAQLVCLSLAVPVFGQWTSTTAAADAPPPALPPVMPPGSACPDGDNGQWNCLSTCWQRCAAGLWTDTMALAPGTRCIPLGLSFDLQIVHASASPPSPSSSAIINATIATLSDATCVCSTTTCHVLPSASPSASYAPSFAPSPSSTTNDAGFKNGASSGSSAVGASIAAVLGLGLGLALFMGGLVCNA